MTGRPLAITRGLSGGPYMPLAHSRLLMGELFQTHTDFADSRVSVSSALDADCGWASTRARQIVLVMGLQHMHTAHLSLRTGIHIVASLSTSPREILRM